MVREVKIILKAEFHFLLLYDANVSISICIIIQTSTENF